MTITFIGIAIVVALLVTVSIVNLIMSMFNSLLFSVLKILAPIGLMTATVYSLINYFGGDVGSGYYLDIITGIITIVYTIIVLKRGTGKGFKILTLGLGVPMIFYLLNDPTERSLLHIFDFSVNGFVTDLVYRYTILGTLDGFMTHITQNIDAYTQMLPNLSDITGILVEGFGSISLRSIGASIVSGIMIGMSSIGSRLSFGLTFDQTFSQTFDDGIRAMIGL